MLGLVKQTSRSWHLVGYTHLPRATVSFCALLESVSPSELRSHLQGGLDDPLLASRFRQSRRACETPQSAAALGLLLLVVTMLQDGSHRTCSAATYRVVKHMDKGDAGRASCCLPWRAVEVKRQLAIPGITERTTPLHHRGSLIVHLDVAWS